MVKTQLYVLNYVSGLGDFYVVKVSNDRRFQVADGHLGLGSKVQSSNLMINLLSVQSGQFPLQHAIAINFNQKASDWKSTGDLLGMINKR